MRLEPTNNKIAVLAIILVVCSLATQWAYLDIARDRISGKAVNSQQAGVKMCVNTPPQLIADCPDTVTQGEPYYCDLNLFDRECAESCLVTNTSMLHATNDTITALWFENRCSRNVTLSEISLSWSRSGRGLEAIMLDGESLGTYDSATPGNFTVPDSDFSGLHELELAFNGSMQHSRVTAGLLIENSTKKVNFRLKDGVAEWVKEEQLCEFPYFFTGTASDPMGPYFSVESSTGFVNMTLPVTYDDRFTGENPYSVNLYGDDGMMCSTSGVNGIMTLDVKIDNHPPHIETTLPTSNVTMEETENESFFMEFEDYDNEGNGTGDNHTVKWLLDGETVSYSNVSYDTSYSRYLYVSDYLSAGNHTIDVEVSDGYYTRMHRWYVTVENLNRPPRFTAALPNQTWEENQIRAAFSLDDYVADPDDDDELSFRAIPSSPFPAIETTIDEENDNLVLFSPPRNWYGEESVSFNVTDGHGGSDLSNVVHLRVQEAESPESTSATDGGGAGSGGAGGAAQQGPCQPEWYCSSWGECSKNGTQTRICYDLAECGTDEGKPPEIQNCTHISHCNNGKRDQVEDGVDCGGPCKPCATCFDREKNQGEEGVDCGGPCPPCPNCSDGIQNQGEEGVDCGGPCPPCPNCSDGIQNQGEEGVDCGGPCEESCKHVEEPSVEVQGEAAQPRFTLSTLLIVLSVVGIVGVIVLFVPPIVREKYTEAQSTEREKKKGKAVVTYDVDSLMEEKGEPKERIERVSQTLRQALIEYHRLPRGLTFDELHEQLKHRDDELSAKMRYVLSHMSEALYKGEEVTSEQATHMAEEVRGLLRRIGKLKPSSPEATERSKEIHDIVMKGWDALSKGNTHEARGYWRKAKDLYARSGATSSVSAEIERLSEELGEK